MRQIAGWRFQQKIIVVVQQTVGVDNRPIRRTDNPVKKETVPGLPGGSLLISS